jgi:hypothetical protein
MHGVPLFITLSWESKLKQAPGGRSTQGVRNLIE